MSAGATTAPQTYSGGGLSGLLRDTLLLMSLRWQITINSWRARKVYQIILFGLLFLWLAAMGVFISGAVGFGIAALLNRYPEGDFEPLLPGIILTAAALILLLSSFGSALSSLFLATDLELLMSAPVDRRAVFISKILDSMGINYAILTVLALPAMITYGITLGYGPFYYILVLVSLIGVPLLPAALGSLLVMLVARFAPARRVREVLGFVAALVGVGCSLIGQTSRFWFRGAVGSRSDLEQLLHSLQSLAALPIPTVIAGRGLADAGNGNLLGALVNLSGFLVITFGFFTGCVLLADRLYATGWVRMQSSGVSKRSRERAAREAVSSGLLGNASAPFAITLKDWRVLPRDLRNFAQLLWPIAVLPVFYFNLVNASREGMDLGQAEVVGIHATGVFLAAGVLTSTVLIFTQIASTAISMEGKSWWILKSAPISPLELLRGKFMEVWLPFAVLSTVLLVSAGIWQRLSLLGLFYGWLGVEILGAGALLVSLSFAVPWAKLDWEDPRRMSSGWGNILAVIIDVLMGALGGAALSAPLLVEANFPEWTAPAFVAGLLICILVVGGISLACAQLAISKLSDVGEA